MPPLMHFFTQAAPDPACLAPHIESEIQPLILFDSIALAARAVKQKAATSRKKTRFIENLQGNGSLVQFPSCTRGQHSATEFRLTASADKNNARAPLSSRAG